ncbi:hypothetical protein SKAU_G00324520 [Synaphobranchus kaupii]|uniref:Uncharacterized protein n=1 Tax=Synaphobranchus kaupii TaxID=118154 RepID=A0A9Q1IK80_SYNKA|nr:hypothetical protein SKAU_G00324520 [Synaphobranchus kaupii]
MGKSLSSACVAVKERDVRRRVPKSTETRDQPEFFRRPPAATNAVAVLILYFRCHANAGLRLADNERPPSRYRQGRVLVRASSPYSSWTISSTRLERVRDRHRMSFSLCERSKVKHLFLEVAQHLTITVNRKEQRRVASGVRNAVISASHGLRLDVVLPPASCLLALLLPAKHHPAALGERGIGPERSREGCQEGSLETDALSLDAARIC